ncbi:hypothetical protein SNOG_12812 [Parastagonospora nodorum SN15]|uniref:Uncharacterized protein n=1 Tax=Phaeosphaeria nodorum (strain SN15 / ATCC MYA-4574 / FGSC 10173) TaxID=321614 RepID=Q0U602_PHANO|nr:hypothetical protein SNOG_12812 [Parastagonospora nodorum SN15]EAT79612.1 hypothetical protein SNOG_12812 [Parastagonospora nodorum SN15]
MQTLNHSARLKRLYPKRHFAVASHIYPSAARLRVQTVVDIINLSLPVDSSILES